MSHMGMSFHTAIYYNNVDVILNWQSIGNKDLNGRYDRSLSSLAPVGYGVLATLTVYLDDLTLNTIYNDRLIKCERYSL